MSGRNRMFLLIMIMIVICLAVAGTSMWILYGTMIEEERERLTETAQSQARLIEAVARFDAIYSKDYPKGALAATLSQITDAHMNYKGFGKTGEFTLARREGKNIVFLLSHRHYDLDNPKPVRFESELAEPMRLALSGKSGTIVGLDYRGEKVLAAYEPLAELDLGIVAKIDLTEFRAPFVKAIIIAFGVMSLFALSGTALFLRVSNPIINRLEEQSKELEKKNQLLTEEIEERKQAEKALRESEEKYRDLFNKAPNAYFSISVIDGSILNCNEKAIQLLGYDEETLSGMKILDLYANTSEGLPKATENFNRFKKGESIRNVELQMKHKDGHPIWISLSVEPIKDHEGDIIESRSMVIDISERKRFESQLRQAQKMEAIGTLTGGIAHQFNNALSGVSLNLELIEMGTDDKETLPDRIDGMNRSIVRMADLTNQLLAYARGGKYQIQKIALNDLINMSLPLLDHAVGPPVELKTELPCDIWRVKVDITQMQMVLIAIIKNAAESIKGEGCISIDCQEAEITKEMEKEFPGIQAVPLVCVSIEDNGKGMDEETKNRIFEPFFTTRFLGRGLGMAAAYGIVKNHDGFIFVDSELGKGTVVRIYLPAFKNHIEET